MNYQRKYKKALWHQIRYPESNKPSPLIKRCSVRRAAVKRSGVKRVWRSTKKSTPSSKAMARRQLSPLSSRQRERLKRYAIAKRRWWHKVKDTLCPVLLTLYGRRVGVSDKPHHVKGRMGSLLYDDRTFLAVSDEGHTFIHNNIEIARQHGWIAQAGEWNKPLP